MEGWRYGLMQMGLISLCNTDMDITKFHAAEVILINRKLHDKKLGLYVHLTEASHEPA